MFNVAYTNNCLKWLGEKFEGLTKELTILKPSDWTVEKRYLPSQVTSIPGYYSFTVSPYIKEILDCFSPHSPVREVAVMKGVQVAFTVGVLENIIGYYMDHIKNMPILFMTADQELSQLRLESYIRPMINHSGLDELIKSSDEKNPRKTGNTGKKIEWIGGGFLVPLGAQNPNKFRSISVPVLLCDEIDGWPDKVGKDGDPIRIIINRTNAFEEVRKILFGSTPLITQTSKINREYNKGDQRKYNVPCKHCNELQELEWNKVNENDGTIYGLTFSHDEDGKLIEGSVVYICKHCQGEMVNDDKAWMFREAGKHCEWIPTAVPTVPHRRSYHISALYSPLGMESWESIVRKWFDCWNVISSTPKDLSGLQEFYNNSLGRPFEMKGEALKLERVVMHRRAVYHSGEVPNNIALKETGSKILFLTLAVDVHKEHLDIQVVGWCKFGRFYSIEWHKFEGDCEDLGSEPWQKLREIIEHKIYKADDGRLYKPQITLIDSQYNTDIVLNFCNDYSNGVFPISGRELSVKNAKINEFSEYTSKIGIKAFNITTTLYKDRLAASFKREWDGESLQPDGYPNFPQDYPEIFFKELTIESKKEKVNKVTGQRMGFVWHGRNAHAWDTMVYNSAAHDMIAFDVCQHRLGLESINREAFWELCESEKLYFEES
jgi:phage terminase large subunit GpA-like protein